MTTYIRTALLSALVLSLTCGFATASDLRTAKPAVASQSHAGVPQALMVKCKDPIECNKGRA
ncbi:MULTISPECIES: hypothetical protein [Luteibacter]|uniref:hypothetical protein n=1 Tax=Luteibacter sp. dw_328 TaxID=2719796 RepID=UPI0007BF5248|nr:MULTISPECIES: hypothetical protein [Luteibacter]